VDPHGPRSDEELSMNKLPKILSIVMIVAGGLMIVVGSFTYYLVHRELADEKIVVSDDAETLAGDEVDGPFSAYSEATIIKEHSKEIADGETYAQLDQDDERRETLMNSSFLRASLFTSVVAFGVAALVAGLGLLFVLVGLAIMALDKRTSGASPPPTEPGTEATAATA
jgi:hypothetical protein